MRNLRANLAGPDVFLRAAEAVLAGKMTICADTGFEDASPLDVSVATEGKHPHVYALSIARANETAIDSCHLMIEGAARATDTTVVIPPSPPDDPLRDLDTFRKAVRKAVAAAREAMAGVEEGSVARRN